MAHRALTGFWGKIGQLQTFTWFHGLITEIKSSDTHCAQHTQTQWTMKWMKNTNCKSNVYMVNLSPTFYLFKSFLRNVLFVIKLVSSTPHSSVIGQTNRSIPNSNLWPNQCCCCRAMLKQTDRHCESTTEPQCPYFSEKATYKWLTRAVVAY